MRRLFRWIVGIASALAIWRVWSRRRQARTEQPSSAVTDPADELRRTLAATRSEAAGDDTARAASPGETSESLDERRARVHAKAEEAAAEMRGDEP